MAIALSSSLLFSKKRICISNYYFKFLVTLATAILISFNNNNNGGRGGVVLTAAANTEEINVAPVTEAVDKLFPLEQNNNNNKNIKKGTPHNFVVELTTSNFIDIVETDPANGLWFIKFYAPWCQHCKKLSPTLDKIAVYMSGKMSIGKVDCTTQEHICKGGLIKEDWNIDSYPTIKVYRDGKYFDYNGELKADSIIDYGEKMSHNNIQIISTIEEAYTSLKKSIPTTDRTTNQNNNNNDDDSDSDSVNSIAFIAYDPNASSNGTTLNDIVTSTKILQIFNQVARIQQLNAKFGLILPNTTQEELLNKFGISSTKNQPFIGKIEKNYQTIFYNLQDEEEESLSSVSLNNFVKQNNHQLICNLGGHNIRDMGMLGKPILIGVYNPDDDDDDENKEFKNDVIQYAKNSVTTINGSNNNSNNKYKFCLMDGKKYEVFLKQFHIGKENLPELFVFDYMNREYYNTIKNNTNNTTKTYAVKEFIQLIENGSIAKKRQDDYGIESNTIIEQVKNIFLDYLPWSGLSLICVLALIVYFLKEEEQENNDDDDETKETTNQNSNIVTKKKLS